MRAAIVALVVIVAWPSYQSGRSPRPDRGSLLESLTWVEAERALSPEAIVVIPVGAASLEHGPHLKMGTDLTVANYLARRISRDSAVVVAPAIGYHDFPGFAEYPGSVSLPSAAAQSLTTEIVRSLARYGPRRFYALNTTAAAGRALGLAARSLADTGILLRYTSIDAALESASRGVRQQPAGSHADEIETSIMLAIDPDAVDMPRAVRDLGSISNPLRLTRQPNGQGTYSASGTWGDATLATKQKGQIVLDAVTAVIASDIEELRGATLPASSPPPSPVSPASSTRAGAGAPDQPQCSTGDERLIRQIGDAFTAYWTNSGAAGIGGLWWLQGDLVHPDGFIERGSVVISQNRAQLFAQPAYRNSRHSITLPRIRCVSADVAVPTANGCCGASPTQAISPCLSSKGCARWSSAADPRDG